AATAVPNTTKSISTQTGIASSACDGATGATLIAIHASPTGRYQRAQRGSRRPSGNVRSTRSTATWYAAARATPSGSSEKLRAALARELKTAISRSVSHTRAATQLSGRRTATMPAGPLQASTNSRPTTIRTSAYVRGEMPRRSDAVWERSTTTSRVRPSDLPTVSVTGTAGASSRRATRSALASVVTGTPSTASRTSPGRTP